MSERYCSVNPHVTRSHTGVRNVLLSTDPQNTEYHVYYVTRCYATRHGSGPLPHDQGTDVMYPGIVDPNNVHNEFQGSIRYGILDLDELFKRINEDLEYFDTFNVPKQNVIKHLAVTCLDQTNIVKFYHNSRYFELNVHDFMRYIIDYCTEDGYSGILFSHGPSSMDVTRIDLG